METIRRTYERFSSMSSEVIDTALRGVFACVGSVGIFTTMPAMYAWIGLPLAITAGFKHT